MASDYTVDPHTSPELARLVEQVWETRRPIHLRIQGKAVIVLPETSTDARRYASSGERAVARLRATHGTVTPIERPEDSRAVREAFERGVAEEVTADTS